MPSEFATALCAIREGRYDNPCEGCRKDVSIPLNGNEYFCLMHAAETAFGKLAEKRPGQSLKLAWVKTPTDMIDNDTQEDNYACRNNSEGSGIRKAG